MGTAYVESEEFFWDETSCSTIKGIGLIWLEISKNDGVL
jgi:hypothetical protein